MSSPGSGPVSGGGWARAVAEPSRMPRAVLPSGTAVPRRVAPPPAYTAVAAPVAPSGIGAYAIALGLIVTTTTAVLAGNWIGGAQATLLVAVVALVEAILLGRSGVGRLVAIGLAIPLCAAVVVPTTIGLIPSSVSSGGLEHTIGEYVLQAFTGLLASGPGDFVRWAFMVGLATIIWACGYWLGWVAFREQRGVLAVLPALVVVGVNVLNAPSVTSGAGPGSSIGLSETMAIFAALLVIGLAELGSLAAGWRRRRIPTLEGVRERYTIALSLASIGVVAASLLIPPISDTDISGNLFNGGVGQGGGQGTRNLANIGFNPVVAPGGQLTNVPSKVLTYYTDQGQSTYLEADVDTVFSAGDWIPDFDTAVGQTFPAGAIPRDSSALGASRSSTTAHIVFDQSASAATGAAGGGLDLFPGDPSSMTVPGTVIGDVAPPATPPTPTPATFPPGYQCIGNACPAGSTAVPVFLSVDEVDLPAQAIHSLATGGSVSTATVTELEGAGTDYPSWVQQDAAPLVGKDASKTAAAEAAAIASLAKTWTAGDTNPYDEATSIESHLRGGAFAYTLTPPKTPANEWPIVYFLDTSHEGYCQYYASAMGAMLRSLGIPTVLLSGYGPGTATGQATAGHQPIFQVTTTDAHAWVEAYFPGYGWVPFEPTPASNFGGYLPFLRGGSTAAPTQQAFPKSHGSTPTPSARAAAVPTSGAGRGTGLPGWGMGLGAALVVAAVLLLVFFRWWRRPSSLAGVWRRLALAGRLAGLDRDVAETRGAFAGRLARALGGGGPPLLEAELGTVAAVSGKAEFSPHGLEDPDHRLWRDTWASLAPAFTRLWRRRLFRRRPAV